MSLWAIADRPRRRIGVRGDRLVQIEARGRQSGAAMKSEDESHATPVTSLLPGPIAKDGASA